MIKYFLTVDVGSPTRRPRRRHRPARVTPIIQSGRIITTILFYYSAINI